MSALRSAVPAAAISVTLNVFDIRACSSGEDDRSAARRIDAVSNRIFLDPMLRGTYPEDLLRDTKAISDWAFVETRDLHAIQQDVDFLGVNYYTPTSVRQAGRSKMGAGGVNEAWPGCSDVDFLDPSEPLTAMGWQVDAEGLTRVLERLSTDYPGLPLVITENGAAYDDEPDEFGNVHDELRIDYLRSHIAAAAAAVDHAVDLRGYFVWSLFDNFEWAFGYSKRFGLIHVDYETMKRTPKASAGWYRTKIQQESGGSGHLSSI